MEDVKGAENPLQINCVRHVHFQKSQDCDNLIFTLKYKQLNEKREIPNENYTIKDLLDELELSAQTMVSKQNGELVIEDSVINDGDEIQLVQIIYGG